MAAAGSRREKAMPLRRMDGGAENADQNQNDVAGYGRLRSIEDQSDVPVTEDVEGHAPRWGVQQPDDDLERHDWREPEAQQPDDDVEAHGIRHP